jgi:hypothetical protein
MVMRSLLTDDRTSLKIGSCCCGIPIALHYSYFLLLVIVLAASARYRDAAFSLFMLTLYGPVLLLTIVIVSAMVVCYLCEGSASRISLVHLAL